ILSGEPRGAGPVHESLLDFFALRVRTDSAVVLMAAAARTDPTTSAFALPVHVVTSTFTPTDSNRSTKVRTGQFPAPKQSPLRAHSSCRIVVRMNSGTSFTIVQVSIATGGRFMSQHSSFTPSGIPCGSLCAVFSNATAYGSGWHLPQTCEPSSWDHQIAWA